MFSTCRFYLASRRILQPLHFYSLFGNPPAFPSPVSASSVGVRVRTRPAYQFLSLRDAFTRSLLVGASAKGIPGSPPQKWKRWVGKVGCNQARARTLRVLRVPFSHGLHYLPRLSLRLELYPTFLPSPALLLQLKKSGAEVTTKTEGVSSLSFSVSRVLPSSLLIPSTLAESPSIAVVKKKLSLLGARCRTRLCDRS